MMLPPMVSVLWYTFPKDREQVNIPVKMYVTISDFE